MNNGKAQREICSIQQSFEKDARRHKIDAGRGKMVSLFAFSRFECHPRSMPAANRPPTKHDKITAAAIFFLP
jgi:hypothetical protein